jgi:hypothetical protein
MNAFCGNTLLSTSIFSTYKCTYLSLFCRVWWTRRSHLKWFQGIWPAWCACTPAFLWGLHGWSSQETIFFLVFMSPTRLYSCTSSNVGTDGIALSKSSCRTSHTLIEFLPMYKLYWITCEGWNCSEGSVVFVVVKVIESEYSLPVLACMWLQTYCSVWAKHSQRYVKGLDRDIASFCVGRGL